MVIEENKQDRRRLPRMEADFEAEIVVVSGEKAGRELPGRVTNITKEGARLKTQAGIPAGAQISLIIYSEDYDSVCLGTVVWAENTSGETHYGVKISSWSYLDPILEHQLHFTK
jgi:hypothetical protein